jgi:ABC-type phosphate transport system substrate-binding protein
MNNKLGTASKGILSTFVMLAAICFARPSQAQVMVIANQSVKATEIAKNDLRDVFTGNATTLKDGSQVVPILLKGGPAHEEFLLVYIGKNDAAYRATWRSLVFAGQATMPKTVDGDTDVVDFVAHTPGAIGYIGKSSPHEGVKVLAVR